MFTFENSLLLVLTYLWGSVPFGFIWVKMATGKNILEHGSGNIGSTNVGRVAGKKWSTITQLCDMLKGLLPVTFALLFSTNDYLVYALAVAAILGHNYSAFLKLKGGKGVNTTLGAAVLLAPISVFGAVGIFYLVKWRLRFVSIGSLVLAVCMPLIEVLVYGVGNTFYFLVLCTALIFVNHQSNIRRLLQRKELQS